MSYRHRDEPYVRLECGCIETTLGAIHVIGETGVWRQFCLRHPNAEGWKIMHNLSDERKARKYVQDAIF